MLARHSILHELGRGEIGAVYAARDRTTGAVVALKRLDPALLTSDASLAGRFIANARSARRLSHSNIVRIHEAGEAAGTAYVAMEMLEGESLRKILDDGPLPIARAIQVAHGIASALAHAHLEGVVHGCLKPSNVIVLRSGLVKVTDFGIGTGGLGYMSPEQMRGDPVDHRSDIFSLGALFYEMLARRRPFEGSSPKELMENMLRTAPPPPSELNQHVPRALDPIVLSMLAGEPATRMPGVPILLRELQLLEEGLGVGSGASAGTAEPAASVPPADPEPVLRTPEPVLRTPERVLRMPEPEFQHRDRTTIDRDALDLRNRAIDRDILDHRRAMMEREARMERSSRRSTIFAALALVIAVLGLAFTGLMGPDGSMGLARFMDDWSGRLERGIAAIRKQEAPARATGAPAPTAPPPVATAPPPVAEPVVSAPEPMMPKPLAGEPVPAAQTPSPRAGPPEESASAGAAPAPAKQLLPPMRPAARTAAQQPEGTARLILSVSPRGELYIDGEHHGTTPPITTFELEPGMHRIEVRSGSRKPYLTYLTVQAGDVRRIRHDFNATPIRPPR